MPNAKHNAQRLSHRLIGSGVDGEAEDRRSFLERLILSLLGTYALMNSSQDMENNATVLGKPLGGFPSKRYLLERNLRHEDSEGQLKSECCKVLNSRGKGQP